MTPDRIIAYERINIEDVCNDIVGAHIQKLVAPVIAKAEAKVKHEDGGCYCSSCLRTVVDKANDAIMLLIGKEDTWKPTKEEFAKVKDYLYFLVPGRKKGFDIVHGWDLDARNYDQWWENVARDKNRPENPDGISPYGSLPGGL